MFEIAKIIDNVKLCEHVRFERKLENMLKICSSLHKVSDKSSSKFQKSIWIS